MFSSSNRRQKEMFQKLILLKVGVEGFGGSFLLVISELDFALEILVGHSSILMFMHKVRRTLHSFK